MPTLPEIAESKTRFFGKIAPLIHDYARSRGIECDLSDVYLSCTRARRGSHCYHILLDNFEHHRDTLESLNSGRPQYDEETFELLKEAMERGKLILLEPGVGRGMVKAGEERRREPEPEPFREQRDRWRMQGGGLDRPIPSAPREP